MTPSSSNFWKDCCCFCAGSVFNGVVSFPEFLFSAFSFVDVQWTIFIRGVSKWVQWDLYPQNCRAVYLKGTGQHNDICTHRRSIVKRGECFQRRLFVCQFVCLSVCRHYNFRTIGHTEESIRHYHNEGATFKFTYKMAHSNTSSVNQ